MKKTFLLVTVFITALTTMPSLAPAKKIPVVQTLFDFPESHQCGTFYNVNGNDLPAYTVIYVLAELGNPTNIKWIGFYDGSTPVVYDATGVFNTGTKYADFTFFPPNEPLGIPWQGTLN
jgi:hypothetical protein